MSHLSLQLCVLPGFWTPQKLPPSPPQTLPPLLTGGMGQVGEERLEATGKPLHALMKVGQSLQVTDVTQDLILGDQFVSQVPSQHLRLFSKSCPERRREEAMWEFGWLEGQACIVGKEENTISQSLNQQTAFQIKWKMTSIKKALGQMCLMTKRHDYEKPCNQSTVLSYLKEITRLFLVCWLDSNVWSAEAEWLT